MNHPSHPLFVAESAQSVPSWIDDAFPGGGKVPTTGFERRRARLNELDSHLHCSLIGTCLGSTDLRKLVPKFSDIDRKASDLEIHHMAVRLASESAEGAKALNKLLDTVYAAEVRRFKRYASADELKAAWAECLKHGDVPGAYWAVMTHPAVNEHLRQFVFGEVHMLSHLVGAANRADIRRLMALEEETAGLKDKVERQQQRLQEMSVERDSLARQAAARACASPDGRVQELEAQVRALEAALQARDQAISHHAGRSARLEEQLLATEERAKAWHAELRATRTRADEMRVEVNALDWHLSASLLAGSDGGAGGADVGALHGKRIVYVGGRPHSTQAIAAVVKRAGGELVLHDGGLEDRRNMLPSALASADLVVFPVDCIAHNPVTLLKKACERHGVPYYPLRTASVTSFLALLMRLEQGQRKRMAPCASPTLPCCPQHG